MTPFFGLFFGPFFGSILSTKTGVDFEGQQRQNATTLYFSNSTIITEYYMCISIFQLSVFSILIYICCWRC